MMAPTVPIIPALLLVVAVVAIHSFLYPFLSETCSPALRRLPGPFSARLSRLWYLWHVSTGQFHHTNIDLHRKYGPIVRIAPKQYSINDPDALKKIYGIGKSFPKSSWYEASSSPDAPFKDLFTDLNHTRHAANRRLVANLYSATALRAMEPDVEDCITVYVEKLRELAELGKPIDLQFWMQCYAFDVISQITVGQRFGFIESGVDQGGMFASLHEYLMYSALVGIVHEWHRTLSWIMTKLPTRGLGYVGKFTLDQIAKRRQALEKPGISAPPGGEDFITRLFRLQKENPEKFPDSAVFTTCITNIGAGSDTTSISLCSIIHNLATHPAALKKLRKEVDDKFRELGDVACIPFTETQSMEYLQACVKEALRLHPATGLPLARVVPEGGATLSGTYFPAGSIVGANTWVVHRNREAFGHDADEFKPERWLDQSKDTRCRMEANWIPFGAGSRTCIGKNISLLEINKLVPVLVRNFDLTVVNSEGQRHENYWLVKQVNILCKVSRRDIGRH